MVDFADLIGVPYREAGRDTATGLDCYGLLLVVFRRAGIELPAVDYDCITPEIIQSRMAQYKPGWRQIEKPVVPCALAIKNRPPFVNHTGVYIGDGRFLHALKKIGVHQSIIDSPQWRNRIEGFYVPR